MLKTIFNVDKTIISNFMVLNGVKSFKEIERDLVFGLKNRLFESGNMIISVLHD